MTQRPSGGGDSLGPYLESTPRHPPRTPLPLEVLSRTEATSKETRPGPDCACDAAWDTASDKRATVRHFMKLIGRGSATKFHYPASTYSRRSCGHSLIHC